MHLVILAQNNSSGARSTSLNTDEENKANLLTDAIKQNTNDKQVVDDVAEGVVNKKISHKGTIDLSQYGSVKLNELQDAK